MGMGEPICTKNLLAPQARIQRERGQEKPPEPCGMVTMTCERGKNSHLLAQGSCALRGLQHVHEASRSHLGRHGQYNLTS